MWQELISPEVWWSSAFSALSRAQWPLLIKHDMFLRTTCPFSALFWYHELWWTWGIFSALVVPGTVTMRKVTLFLYFDSPLECRTWYKFSAQWVELCSRCHLHAAVTVILASHTVTSLVHCSFLTAWNIFIIVPGKRGTSSTFLRTGGKFPFSHFSCRSCYHSSASEQFSYCSGTGEGRAEGLEVLMQCDILVFQPWFSLRNLTGWHPCRSPALFLF